MTQEAMIYTFIAFLLILVLMATNFTESVAKATTPDLWMYTADVNYSMNDTFSGQYNQSIVSGYASPPVCETGLVENIGCVIMGVGWLFSLMGTNSPLAPLSYTFFIPMAVVMLLIILKILKDVIPFT